LGQPKSEQVATVNLESLLMKAQGVSNLVEIGTRAKFPFPEAFPGDGFELGDDQSRSLEESKVLSSPDNDGVIKEIISPWNDKRVLLTLSSQTKKSLDQVQDLLRQDPLFF
jgi:hypothetical protein